MKKINKNSNQSRNKIIPIVLLVLLAIFLIACIVGYFGLRNAIKSSVKLDAGQIKNYATQITDYDVPVGYKESAGSYTFGVINILISDASQQNMIYLAQAPSNLPDPDNFLRTVIIYQKNNPIRWGAVDARVYSIRGTKSPITVYDGVAQDGQKYHAWVGKFTGKGGPAFVVIVGPSETWNDSVAEAFLLSMR